MLSLADSRFEDMEQVSQFRGDMAEIFALRGEDDALSWRVRSVDEFTSQELWENMQDRKAWAAYTLAY